MDGVLTVPLSTTAARVAWAPACPTNQLVTVNLNGSGRVTVRAAIVEAVAALNLVLIAYNYVTRRADTGGFNCLSGETKVMTREGWVPIVDLAGRDDVELLVPRGPLGTNAFGGPGTWRKAEVRSFGEQQLMKVVLERYGVQRVVHATRGHRWFVRGEGQGACSEVTTDELQVRDGRRGHRLRSIRPQSVASRTIPSAVGIMAGLVYGDGTLDRHGARIALHGKKNEALLRYFPEGQVRHRYHHDVGAEPYTAVTGLPRSWKNRVPSGEGAAHDYGWLAGYFAADGRVSKNGTCELSSVEEWRLEEARRVALRLGITTSPITSTKRETEFSGGEVSTLYALRLDPRSLDSSFFLIPEHRERWNAEERKAPPDWSVVSVAETDRVEEVFCAVVPGVEAFAIEDFILTGNCRAITGGRAYSLHAYGIAIDINWQSNPYGPVLVTDMDPAMVAAILSIRTNGGAQVWRWGGSYRGNKDGMHFEVVCTPAELATGIRGLTDPVIPVPPMAGPDQTPPSTSAPFGLKEDNVHLIRNNIVNHPAFGEVWQLRDDDRLKVTTGYTELKFYANLTGSHVEVENQVLWDELLARYPDAAASSAPAEVFLARAVDGSRVYVTDFVTRSLVPTERQLQSIQFVWTLQGRDTTIHDLAPDVLADIPLNLSSEDLTRVINQTSAALFERLGATEPGVSADHLASALADELGARLTTTTN